MSKTDPTIPSSDPSPTSHPLGGDGGARSEEVQEGPGTVLGAYRLLQVLGEGGFGVVYLAEQREPVERRVALKIIKLGLETKEVLARFEAERQAMALMDHPAIAKVLDAGATPAGRPYFVMEFVAGVPVHEYCDQHRLTTSERLKLFVDICSAVHHAHQKGVIHRDLKPSNIMVTLLDGRPAPKVIDFGIAKATTRRLTERTIFTETGRLLGTPEYMSPEQAGTTGLDVDTRTDVYSLGVVLYQLLVGSLPFDSRTLRSAGYEGIMRIIREEDPPRMSTRLAKTPATISTTAEKRRSDARTLVNQLRGDLDWITARAMEKDRTRRYASVSELAADVERFLKSEPVVARPPSVSYKVAKFVRRNRLGVSAVAVVLLALVLGLGGTTWGMVRARAAEQAERSARTESERAREAAEAAREREAEQKRRALAESAKASAINVFLQNTLASVSPANTNKRDITVREVLDEARRIGVSFKDQPEVDAALRETMGRTYRSLGMLDEAEGLITGALNARLAIVGPEHVDVAECYDDLSVLRYLQGKHEDAERLARQGLELRRKLLGPQAGEVGDSLSNLAIALSGRGRHAEAEGLLVEALAIHKSARGETHPSTLQTMINLAAALWRQGKSEEAIRTSRQLLAIQEALPEPENRNLARTLFNLGEFLRATGKLDEAEGILRRSVDIRRRVLAPNHPELGNALGNLALVLQAKNDLDGAEALLVEALDVARKAPGGPRADIDYDLQNFANFLLDRGKPEPAEAHAREALRIRTARVGERHPETGYTRLALGRAVMDQGRASEAEPLLRLAVELISQDRGAAPVAAWNARSALGGSLVALGRLDEAKPILLESYERIVGFLGEKHLRARQTARRLAALFTAQGDAEQAAEWQRRAE
ncbi:MAG: tetratricopeptide repeat protein [Phycisphaerales bacterium]